MARGTQSSYTELARRLTPLKSSAVAEKKWSSGVTMNKRPSPIRDHGDADMLQPTNRSTTLQPQRSFLLIRSSVVLLAFVIFTALVGCSGPAKSGTSPFGHLLSATLRPTSRNQANAQPEKKPAASASEIVDGNDVSLATFVQAEPPPPTTEQLPIPDVPQSFEQIQATQPPGMNPPGNYSTHSELPPLRPGHQPPPPMVRQIESSGSVAVKMRGDLLRSPNETATEISLRQQKLIALLEHQIETGKAERQDLWRQLLDERRAHKRTDSKLANGLKEILRLRKMTAKLQVQIDDLLATNKRIRQESEAALQTIESNLDAALFQKISGPRQN